MPVLVRAVTSVRKRTAAARRTIATDWPGRQIDRWYTEWRPEIVESLRKARAIDVGPLSDREFDEYLLSVIHLTHRALIMHFTLHGAIGFILGTFAATCRELLGWADDRNLAMLAGTSTTSTAAARDLAGLTAIAARSPGLRRLLSSASVDEASVDRAMAADPEFADAFAHYLDVHCYRAMTNDLADPTLLERPELVLNLVRDQLVLAESARPQPGDGAADIENARSQLTFTPAEDRERFERDLDRALRAYPVREDNVYPTGSAPFALVRFAALELGRRLTARGLLEDPDDVFQLRADEARLALIDGNDQIGLVRRRKAERARVLANPGPASYGRDPGHRRRCAASRWNRGP